MISWLKCPLNIFSRKHLFRFHLFLFYRRLSTLESAAAFEIAQLCLNCRFLLFNVKSDPARFDTNYTCFCSIIKCHFHWSGNWSHDQSLLLTCKCEKCLQDTLATSLCMDTMERVKTFKSYFRGFSIHPSIHQFLIPVSSRTKGHRVCLSFVTLSQFSKGSPS